MDQTMKPGITDPSFSSLKIRSAVEEDLPALEWDGEYRHFRRLYRDIFRSAQRGEAILWVAELEGQVIGQLFVQLSSGRPELADGLQRAYIYGFRVRTVYRDKGVGTRMMQAAEADLIQRGYQVVTLNVNRDNPGARRLYERLGYRVVAAEEGRWSYIDDRGIRREVHEPAWRMVKRLYR
jgi:ribosomal protein S18 acetylase RimI-like enzyme